MLWFEIFTRLELEVFRDALKKDHKISLSQKVILISTIAASILFIAGYLWLFQKKGGITNHNNNISGINDRQEIIYPKKTKAQKYKQVRRASENLAVVPSLQSEYKESVKIIHSEKATILRKDERLPLNLTRLKAINNIGVPKYPNEINKLKIYNNFDLNNYRAIDNDNISKPVIKLKNIMIYNFQDINDNNKLELWEVYTRFESIIAKSDSGLLFIHSDFNDQGKLISFAFNVNAYPVFSYENSKHQ